MSSVLSKLYLARHGDTAWTDSHQHTGRTDIPLNARGEEHARQLGERLRGFSFVRVFTSPLQRASKTCELAGFGAVAEVDIHCPEKAKAETLLKEAILEKLDGMPAGQQVLLKLTLPEQADFYTDCVRHPKVVRVVALSGGYTQAEADARLRKNHGVVASFSRALLEGLSVHQTDAQFNAMLDASIRRIYEASIT